MSIFGIGSDVAPVNRFAKLEHENAAIMYQRLFTETEASELQEIGSSKARHRAFAKSFAIKEAVFKALGTGLIDGMSWKDVQVTNSLGSCQLTTFGRTHTKFSENSIASWQLTSSSTSELAIACVILLK